MHMSPALSGSSAIRRFESIGVIEIRDGITFEFYTGLPHIASHFLTRGTTITLVQSYHTYDHQDASCCVGYDRLSNITLWGDYETITLFSGRLIVRACINIYSFTFPNWGYYIRQLRSCDLDIDQDTSCGL